MIRQQFRWLIIIHTMYTPSYLSFTSVPCTLSLLQSLIALLNTSILVNFFSIPFNTSVMPSTSKVCSRCRRDLSISEFVSKRGGGETQVCLECRTKIAGARKIFVSRAILKSDKLYYSC